MAYATAIAGLRNQEKPDRHPHLHYKVKLFRSITSRVVFVFGVAAVTGTDEMRCNAMGARVTDTFCDSDLSPRWNLTAPPPLEVN